MPLNRSFAHEKFERKFNFLWVTAMIFWVLSAIAGLALTGVVIYILWRVATHPW